VFLVAVEGNNMLQVVVHSSKSRLAFVVAE
jgi:hypothetical protein